METEKTLSELTAQIVRTFKEYEKIGTAPWTYKTAAADLSYQVGSLTKALMQLHGERFRDGKSDDEIKRVVADELADILAEVLFVSHELNISLEDAWNAMNSSDEKKIKERS